LAREDKSGARISKFGRLPEAELGLELDKNPPSSVSSRSSARAPVNHDPFCSVNSSHKTHA
jgi:hypothetical protein